MNRIVLSTLAVILLLVMPATPAAAQETYESEWEGIPFTEFVDPLRRFIALPVSDADGDGIGNLVHLQADSAAEVVGSLAYVTNADIESEMQRLGWSRDYVIAQIYTVLGNMPEYAAVRTQASEYVNQGLYTSAATTLTGTPADIVLWCGPLGSPTKYPWVVAIPTVLRCDSDLVNDVGVAPEVTSAALSNGKIDRIDILVSFQGLNPLLTARQLVGAGYGNNNGGIYTTISVNTFTGTLNLNGLTTSTYNGRAKFDSPLGFRADDRFYYTYGGTLSRAKSVALVPTAGLTSFHVDFTFWNRASNDWDLRAALSTTSNLYADAYLQLPGSRVLQLQAFTLPSSLTLGYTESTTTLHHKHGVRLNAGSSVFNTEIKGTLFNAGNAEASFQFVGLPTQNVLTLNLGDNNRGLASFDLTKTHSSVGGRYRTVLVNGQVEKMLIDGQVADAHRVNLVMGGSDPWDSDGDVFVTEGANFATSSGSIDLKAKENWLKQYRGKMNVNCWNCGPKTYNYELGPSPTCTVSCTGTVSEGFVTENDSLFFNGHFWGVSADQLGTNWCARLFDGTCY